MASDHETIFTMEATPVKFGTGASAEAGWELKRLGVTRAMLVTDPGVAELGHPDRIRKLIEAEGIEVVLYDRSRVEPTLHSFQHAADFAVEHEVDGFVSVGGGSSMDTAKVANLVSTGRPSVRAARAFGDRHCAGGVSLHPRRHARGHHQVAELLAGEPISDAGPDALPDVLRQLMKDVEAPRGVAEFGYGEDDIPTLVDGAMKQQRLLAVAPKEVSEDDLHHIITASMTNW